MSHACSAAVVFLLLHFLSVVLLHFLSYQRTYPDIDVIFKITTIQQYCVAFSWIPMFWNNGDILSSSAVFTHPFTELCISNTKTNQWRYISFYTRNSVYCCTSREQSLHFTSGNLEVWKCRATVYLNLGFFSFSDDWGNPDNLTLRMTLSQEKWELG